MTGVQTCALPILIKKNRQFKLKDVAKAINLMPAVKRGYIEINNNTRKKIRELMFTTESNTHPSLAHEVFQSQRKYKLSHITHLFGPEATKEMLNYYIVVNKKKSVPEVAADFGMHKSVVFKQMKKSALWRQWYETKKEARTLNAEASKARELNRIEWKAKRLAESKARLEKKLAKKKKKLEHRAK